MIRDWVLGFWVVGVIFFVLIINTPQTKCVVGMKNLVFMVTFPNQTEIPVDMQYDVEASLFGDPVEVKHYSSGFDICLNTEQYETYSDHVIKTGEDPLDVSIKFDSDFIMSLFPPYDDENDVMEIEMEYAINIREGVIPDLNIVFPNWSMEYD